MKSDLWIDINYEKVDVNGFWRLDAIFTELTAIATSNAMLIGAWSMEQTKRYGWIVSKVRLKLARPIKLGERVHLITWPASHSRIVYHRHFLLEDDQGKTIGEATSQWALLDLESRRVCVPERLGMALPNIEVEDFNLTIDSDFETEGLEVTTKRQVRYSDLDMNRHMNNARYVLWGLDELEAKMFEGYQPMDVSVYFKKETGFNDTLLLGKEMNDQQFRVVGKDEEGNVHFVMEGTWQQY